MTGSDQVEFIITVQKDLVPKTVKFEQLNSIRDKITSLTFLWTTNSYYVNIVRKYFIINGGRRLQIEKDFHGYEKVALLYCKRHTITMGTNEIISNGGGVKKHNIFYIMGLQGIGDEPKEILLHISPNGRMWKWLDHR